MEMEKPLTEHAECPECLDDGPHEIRSDGDLQCHECGEVFPNPFDEEVTNGNNG